MIFLGFMKKEITQMLRNPVMVFALLLMPLVQAFLLCYAITNEPKNISLAIDSAPDDYLMTRVYDRALASGWFLKIKPSEKDAFKTIQSGKADVVMIAPKGGLTKTLLSGEPTDLQLLIDATNVLKAQSVSGYVRAILGQVLNEELQKHPSFKQNKTVTFHSRVLFNPEMDTKMFIVPAILAMIIGSTILSLVCIGITKEKEVGTIETLISAPIKKTDIILGKTIPCVVVALFNMLSIALIGLLFFHVPFRGSLMFLGLSFLAFSFAFGSLGVFIADFCKTQQQAMLMLMMVIFILMMLSGSMFPIENMPKVLRVCANINPLSHYIFLTRNIFLKGGPFSYFWQHTWPMLTFGAVFLSAGIYKFKQTV